MFASTTCAPSALSAEGSTPFTFALVPTGTNAGVSITPWGVVRTPARAAPCLAVIEKEMAPIQVTVLDEGPSLQGAFIVVPVRRAIQLRTRALSLAE